MAEPYSRYLAKIYEPAYISQGADFTGADINTFQKKTGSRMQLAVSIHNISGGATLNVVLENAATLVNPVFAEVFNKTYTAAGIETTILLDLNRYCTLTVTVLGGTATYAVVVTLVDNASSEDFSTDSTARQAMFTELAANSRWLDLAVYTSVEATVSGTTLTLDYYEIDRYLGTAVVTNYTALSGWTIQLTSYLDDDAGDPLEGDDGVLLNLG